MLSKTWLIRAGLLSAALLMGVACATGTPTEDDDGAGGGGAGTPFGVLAGYAHRQAITVSDGAPAEVAVAITINHAQLVMEGKSAEDGSDVRITHFAADGTLTELDRVVDPHSAWNQADTMLWFRIPAVVDGTASYHVYYGNPDSGVAPEDAANVYDLWDDFEDGVLDPAWTFSGLSGATGEVGEVEGALRVTATSQDFGGTTDEIGVALREWSGDFRIEVALRSGGGSLGALSKAGGITVRGSTADNARHATISVQQTPFKRVRLFRPDDGADTDTIDVDAPETFPQFVRLDRIGNATSTSYLDQSGAWLQLGSLQTFLTPLPDPVLVGVPLSNNSGGNGWAEVEWMRLNKIVDPAPSASVSGTEENF